MIGALATVDIPDPLEVELVEVMWPVLSLVPFVLVQDPIAEGIFGTAQAPREDFCLVRSCWVRNDGRVGFPAACRAIAADQPILAPHFPMVRVRIDQVSDSGEQTFGAGTIPHESIADFDRNQIFSAGEHEHVGIASLGVVVIPRDAFTGEPRHTRDTQAPAETEGAIPTAGAVPKSE